jgi:hypothetical protein
MTRLASNCFDPSLFDEYFGLPRGFVLQVSYGLNSGTKDETLIGKLAS